MRPYFQLSCVSISLFVGILVFIFVETACSASATAVVGCTIVSTTDVAITAAAELLQSASTGALTLSIPGAGASALKDGATDGMTLTSTGVRGNTIVFSTTDTAPLAALVSALTTSGGTVGVNGTLSTGQGVSLSITHAVDNGNGKGTVHAIVAYD